MSEQKLRKQWLIATFSFFVIYPVLQFLISAIKPAKEPLTTAGIYASLGYGMAELLMFWSLWHCAHKKRGTKLLIFWLALGPFRLLALIAFLIKGSPDAWAVAEVMIDIAIYCWWYFLSFKLRKLNKELKSKKAHPPEYLASVEMLQSATSLGELDEKLSELINAWPQFESTTSKEYKAKKSELIETK